MDIQVAAKSLEKEALEEKIYDKADEVVNVDGSDWLFYSSYSNKKIKITYDYSSLARIGIVKVYEKLGFLKKRKVYEGLRHSTDPEMVCCYFSGEWKNHLNGLYEAALKKEKIRRKEENMKDMIKNFGVLSSCK